MRKFLKYFFRVLLILVILLLLLVALVYVPGVQRYAKDKIAHYVSSVLGKEVEIGQFSLKFPLDLTLQDVFAGEKGTDTLVWIGKLQVDVGLKRVLKKELAVRNLSLEKVRFHLKNDTTGMRLEVDLDSLRLQANRVDLKQKIVEADFLDLSGGDVFLKGGKTVEKDTVSSPPFDWTFQVETISLKEVKYRMETETLPVLQAGLEEGKLYRGKVRIAAQEVAVDSLYIRGGKSEIFLAETQGTSVKKDTSRTDTAALWTVTAQELGIENYAFRLHTGGQEGIELALKDIGIRIDSVYNRGTEVRAYLKQLQVVRQGGGEIDAMRADIDLQPERTQAGNVYIRTPNSVIRLDAVAAAGISEITRTAPLQVKLNATLGMEDVALLVKDLPVSLKKKTLQLQTNLSYQEKEIKIGSLQAILPGHFALTASGHLTDWQDWKKVTGNIGLRGDLENLSFLDPWLGTSVVVPENLRLVFHGEAQQGTLRPDLRLCRDEGCVSVKGNWTPAYETYDFEIESENFDLQAFLPADSLGRLTAQVQLRGKGYRFGKADTRLLAEVNRLDYKGYAYQEIRLAAGISGWQLSGQLNSQDSALLADLTFTVDSVDGRYKADINGDIKKADLKAMHLMSSDFCVATGIEIKASADRKEDYLMNGKFSHVRLKDGRGNYDLGDLVLQLDSDRKQTDFHLVSGDFYITFRSDTSFMQLSPMLGNTVKEIQKQVDSNDVDMEAIRRLLPDFNLKVEGNRDNLLSRYLKTKGIAFRKLDIRAGTWPGEQLYLNADIDHPVYGKLEFDSIKVDIKQDLHRLDYSLNVMNPVGIVKDLYNVTVEGSLVQNQLEASVIQRNRDGENGLYVGARLTMSDSAWTVSLFPVNPVMGYSHWTVNEDNYLTFYKDRRIEANLSLSYENRLLAIRSQGKGEEERLQIEMNGINLASVSGAIPFVPDLSGSLNTDLLLYRQNSHLMANGKVSVDSFYYRQQRIGNILLDLNYDAADQFTRHTIDFSLHLDNIRRAIVKGSFSTSDQNKEVDIHIGLPSFPLYVVNAFLPSQVLTLGGELEGDIQVEGTLDRPTVDGYLAFQGGRADVRMLGTSFVIDSTSIPVRDGSIFFNDFRITSPNAQPLTVNGDIALTPFSDMRMDLRVKANNFQVVDVKENPTSLVYGKAYVDLTMALNGPFDGLNVTGNVNLLNRTVLDYVLRNSEPQLRDKTQDLVRFVSFQDSTLYDQDQLTNRVNTGNFSMKMFVEIGEAVSMNIDLSEDGNNRVSIQGGGNLIFSISPESGNNLVGKYTLTGGMVRYNIPVVGEKIFAIKSGSYVEWTGNLANPLLNITASESLRVSVTEDNQSSRIVNFEAMVKIENNLEQPQVTFDLAASNDQALQTQLAAFSQEERAKQALNLLIYGTYSGPGTTEVGGNANNTLNNFVEKELNQWTRKYLKNSGLTFGIDTYNQIGANGQEVKRTDYSYQFSKQLFNDKINVKIGGRISSDNDPGTSMEENLVDDIAIEYMITKKRDLFLKVFRHTNYESVLEGEVTQTGVGIVWRKSFRKVKDLFVRKAKRLEREKNRQK